MTAIILDLSPFANHAGQQLKWTTGKYYIVALLKRSLTFQLTFHQASRRERKDVEEAGAEQVEPAAMSVSASYISPNWRFLSR